MYLGLAGNYAFKGEKSVSTPVILAATAWGSEKTGKTGTRHEYKKEIELWCSHFTAPSRDYGIHYIDDGGIPYMMEATH